MRKNMRVFCSLKEPFCYISCTLLYASIIWETRVITNNSASSSSLVNQRRCNSIFLSMNPIFLFALQPVGSPWYYFVHEDETKKNFNVFTFLSVWGRWWSLLYSDMWRHVFIFSPIDEGVSVPFRDNGVREILQSLAIWQLHQFNKLWEMVLWSLALLQFDVNLSPNVSVFVWN